MVFQYASKVLFGVKSEKVYFWKIFEFDWIGIVSGKQFDLNEKIAKN